MVRYIDADKLKQDLVDLYDFAKWDPREIHFSLLDMVANIDGEPTADVAPVVHAHWIEEEDLNCNPIIRCSACKDVWHIESDSDAFGDHFYSCPNCGAKMDEEVE